MRAYILIFFLISIGFSCNQDNEIIISSASAEFDGKTVVLTNPQSFAYIDRQLSGINYFGVDLYFEEYGGMLYFLGNSEEVYGSYDQTTESDLDHSNRIGFKLNSDFHPSFSSRNCEDASFEFIVQKSKNHENHLSGSFQAILCADDGTELLIRNGTFTDIPITINR